MYPNFSIKQIQHAPYLFFTGKGGVGKTSTACATAVALADQGKRVLIVSTDPASNLQDVFGLEIASSIMEIPSVPGLFAVNLDPDEAAATYRDKIIGPYRDKLPTPVIAQMEEQLSGACTVEIAAFDEFANLLTNEAITINYDHIIFDTAPTGHTLRLLQLPTAWSGFLKESTHGASCLGPLSGLAEKKSLYEATVNALSDKDRTTLILVTKPDRGAIREAKRASKELYDVGLQNQRLIINGIFQPTAQNPDEVAKAWHKRQQSALRGLEELEHLPISQLPYVPYPLTGNESLRSFLNGRESIPSDVTDEQKGIILPGLSKIIEYLSEKNHGVVLTMGKGGVGKTTIASAIAVGLASKEKKVHLTTTDPAAHLSQVLRDETVSEFLSVSRIDPHKEVEKYRQEVLIQVGADLDEEGLAYLKEDLESPCTEEIAVFRAFADVVERAEREFVIIDTAPTGHTLLLLDATQSYTQEIERSSGGDLPTSVKTLLPRLRNVEETDVIVVTLPEATPVLEASRLQADLERAGMSPSWWVINQSLSITNTNDPILRARGETELPWIKRVVDAESRNVVLLPWLVEEVEGVRGLRNLSSGGAIK